MGHKFNWRTFISVALLFSFIIMMISGIILYIAPEGSLSRWINWDVFSLSKKQWEQQHTVFSYLFIIFSVLHVFKINWFLLKSYFFAVKIKPVFLKEIVISIIIVALVFVGTLFDWRPFVSVVDFGNQISESHARNVHKPAVNDAEKLSLDEFANKVLGTSYSEMAKQMKVYDLNGINKDTTVLSFCKQNNITPQKFYIELKNKIRRTSVRSS